MCYYWQWRIILIHPVVAANRELTTSIAIIIYNWVLPDGHNILNCVHSNLFVSSHWIEAGPANCVLVQQNAQLVQWQQKCNVNVDASDDCSVVVVVVQSDNSSTINIVTAIINCGGGYEWNHQRRVIKVCCEKWNVKQKLQWIVLRVSVMSSPRVLTDRIRGWWPAPHPEQIPPRPPCPRHPV